MKNTHVVLGANEERARKSAALLEERGYSVLGAYVGSTRSTNPLLNALPHACLIIAGEQDSEPLRQLLGGGHVEYSPAQRYGWGAGDFASLDMLIKGEWA
jgi:L-alanine-DL-glutamate epimerase-like enolase superfamily enzyme